MISHSISDEGLAYRWNSIDWKEIEARVAEMQRDISIASQNGDSELLEELSERFLRSEEARALAVKRVTRNDTTDHPGVGEAWRTDADRCKAVMMLDHRNYRSDPIFAYVKFENKTKKDRLFVVPTFYDRAIQQLYLMLMEPICEPLYDSRLFSRPGRNIADAATEVARLFDGPDAPKWVARCDVKSFYDTMVHDEIIRCTPMDSHLLKEMLKAPRWMDGKGPDIVPDMGSPTGNRLSPVIANMMLNGLEDFMRNPNDPDSGIVVRWVDDIVITATSEDDALRNMAKMRRFLHAKGLRLNDRKSYVASLEKGFEFLKYRISNDGTGVKVSPTDEGVNDFIGLIRSEMYDESTRPKDIEGVVKKVNAHLRSFFVKYRFADISGCAGRIDSAMASIALEKIAKLSGISVEDAVALYSGKDADGIFVHVGDKVMVRTCEMVPVPITPVLIHANPFIHTEYFERKAKSDQAVKVSTNEYRTIWASTNGLCALCGLRIRRDQDRDIMERDGVKAYVHGACARESEMLGTEPEFLPEAFAKAGDREEAVCEASEIDTVTIEPVPEPEPVEEPKEEPADDPAPVAGQTTDETIAKAEVMRLEDVVPKPKKNTIVFRTKRGTVSKYQPILDWIQAMNAPYLDLSFKAINDAISGGLCTYAYQEREWWSRKGRSSMLEALAVIGWEVETVDMDGQTVRFRPRTVHYTPAEESYVSRRNPNTADESIRERDARMAKSKFGKLTAFLLGCGMDQIHLGFDRIEEITGMRLSEWAYKDYRYWSARKDGQPLKAIEDGDFTKTDVDMEKRVLKLTRSCCIPDEEAQNVPKGKLAVKEHMVPWNRSTCTRGVSGNCFRGLPAPSFSGFDPVVRQPFRDPCESRIEVHPLLNGPPLLHRTQAVVAFHRCDLLQEDRIQDLVGNLIVIEVSVHGYDLHEHGRPRSLSARDLVGPEDLELLVVPGESLLLEPLQGFGQVLVLPFFEADPVVPLDERRLESVHELRCGQPLDDRLGVSGLLPLDLLEDRSGEVLQDLLGRFAQVVRHLERRPGVGSLPADPEVAVLLELRRCLDSEFVSDLLEGLIHFVLCCRHFLQLLFFGGFPNPGTEKERGAYADAANVMKNE